jgi:hypothetical protein
VISPVADVFVHRRMFCGICFNGQMLSAAAAAAAAAVVVVVVLVVVVVVVVSLMK